MMISNERGKKWVLTKMKATKRNEGKEHFWAKGGVYSSLSLPCTNQHDGINNSTFYLCIFPPYFRICSKKSGRTPLMENQ